jgi:phage-related protein
MALGYDGSIRIDSKIDSKGFNTGIKSMMSSLKGLAAAVGLAFGVGAVVLFGKSAVSAASDLAAAMTGLKSVLDGTGKSFAEGRKFIDSYIKDGLVPATNAITAYKNLALRGYSTEQIEKTLTALKDSAAFGRQSSLSLGQAVQSATEGLKNENSILVDNAGVTKNVAKMWDDYARSIGTTANNLTKQQKIQAEVNGILEETRFQTGDAAKLAGGYAGMVAALGTSFYNLRVAVGKAIIPILQAIIPVIKMAVDWLVVLVNQFAQVMAILFGVQAGTDAVADSTDSAADAAQNQADSIEAAEQAAKGALAAFDELNVLQKEPAAAPGGTPADTPVFDPGGVDEGLDGLADKVAEFKEKFLELIQPVTDALTRLKDALLPLGQTIWEGLKWAWDNILVPLGEWVITEALPAFIDLLAAGVIVLNTALEVLKPLALAFFEDFLKPAAKWVGAAIINALKWLTDRLYELSDWMKNHQKTVEKIATVIALFAAAWLAANIAVGLWTAVVTIATAVTAAFGIAVAILTSPILLVVVAIAALIGIIYLLITHWDWVKTKAAEAWEYIKYVWILAKDWFNTNVFIPLKDWFFRAWEDIKGFAFRAWDAVKERWSQAKDWFNNTVLIPLKNFFVSAWDTIKRLPSDAWEAIKGVWQSAAGWFQSNVMYPIQNGFNTVLGTIRTAFETVFTGIKNFIRGQINTIIDFINTMINALVSGMNTAINAINSIHVTIPSWVPGIGGQGWGIFVPPLYAPQIPRLATGAVIPPNAEFAAILGDHKSQKEILAPEDLIRQIVREETSRSETAVNVTFGGSLGELVRMLKPQFDVETRRIGGSLITAKG